MPSSTNSQTQTKTPDRSWLKPEQIDDLRTATVEHSADYLAARNDALITLLADTGLRVGEVVQVTGDMFDSSDGVLRIPGGIQKQYPNESGSPGARTIELDSDTIRTLQTYRNSRWKDSDYLFPSRQSDDMTEQSVRNVVRSAAERADTEPHIGHSGRGEPSDVTPHALRHSVAYRMLEREDGNTLYAVSRRLRHSSIQTTEQIYSHFDRV
jgi:integrase/recombinase XerC/integrase/recombinase XerD